MLAANSSEGLSRYFVGINQPTTHRERSSTVQSPLSKPESTADHPETHQTVWTRLSSLLKKINPS